MASCGVNQSSRTIARLLLLAALFTALAAAAVPASTFILAAQGPPGSHGNLTVSVNVPTQPSVDDDLYFSVYAPSELSWYGFGFGTGMNGALMFVVYTATDGRNVTVSPRLGLGHVEPHYTSAVGIALLEGSGIQEGGQTMVANFRCTHCYSWEHGSIDANSKSQPMIYAIGAADISMQSSSLMQTINQHIAMGLFYMDLSAASGAGGVPAPTNQEVGVSSVHEEGDVGGGPSGAIHALFMLGSFVVLFPAGHLFLRLFERLWVHVALQSFGLFVVLLGAGSGIAISIRRNQNPHLNSPHQGIGLVVTLGVLTQWIMGMVHHQIYKRRQTPTTFGQIHRFLGPAVIALGLINGALGFNFADRNLAIAGYAAAVVLMATFVTILVWLKKRRQTRKGVTGTPAAQNFRAAHYSGGPQYVAMGGGPRDDPEPYEGAGGDAVPLQKVPHQRECSRAPPSYEQAPLDSPGLAADGNEVQMPRYG